MLLQRSGGAQSSCCLVAKNGFFPHKTSSLAGAGARDGGHTAMKVGSTDSGYAGAAQMQVRETHPPCALALPAMSL